MTKPLLLLAALTLCYCITTMHAFSRKGCQCMSYSTNPVPIRAIKKVEMTTISGYCRRAEVIITRRNGKKMCTKLGQEWLNNVLKQLQDENEAFNCTLPPTSTTEDVNI